MNLKTSCRYCPFAVKEGLVQTGCAAGRLDRYAAQGPLAGDRDEASGEAWVLVPDRLCNLLPAGRHLAEHQGVTDGLLAKARNEVRVRVKVVIPVLAPAAPDAVVTAFRSALAQTLPPACVSVLALAGACPSVPLYRALEAVGAGVPWGLRTVAPPADFWGLADADAAAWPALAPQYVVACEPGRGLDPDYLALLDGLANDELENVYYVDPLEAGGVHGLVYDHPVRESLGRDREGSTRDKLGRYALPVRDALRGGSC